MNKYVQQTLNGKQSTSKLGYNKIEPEIDKDGKKMTIGKPWHVCYTWRMSISVSDVDSGNGSGLGENECKNVI